MTNKKSEKNNTARWIILILGVFLTGIWVGHDITTASVSGFDYAMRMLVGAVLTFVALLAVASLEGRLDG